jgi:hypothetical protein
MLCRRAARRRRSRADTDRGHGDMDPGDRPCLVAGSGHDDANGAVAVGPVDVDAGPFERRDHVGMRMPMAVVGPNPDEPDARAGGDEERVQARARPVVGNGQQIGTEPLRAFEQESLRSLLDVPGEKHRTTTPRDPEDDRHLVRLRPGSGEGPSLRRPQDLERDITEHEPVACDGMGDRHRSMTRRRVDLRHERAVGRQSRPPDHADVGVPEHRQEPGHVVDVLMRRDGERDGAMPRASQPPSRRRVRSCVEEDLGAG